MLGLPQYVLTSSVMKKCPTCDRTYADDTFSFCLADGALLSASYDPDATLVLRSAGVDRQTVGIHSQYLPISLVPADPNIFKQELLRSRMAEIVTTFNDGRVETKTWKAVNFRPSSNVIGNLRSRPQFRAGQWQARGITKVVVRVLKNA